MISAMLELRPAGRADAYALWLWANDPATMHASGRLLPFSWAEHMEWFRLVLEMTGSCVFIGADQSGQPVGTARFDVTGRGPEQLRFSYAVAPERRGQGWGAPLVASAMRALPANNPPLVFADVRPENERSLRVFRRLRWSETGHGEMVRFLSKTP